MAGTKLTREAEQSLQLHIAALPYLRENWPEKQQIIRKNLALLNRRRRSDLAQSWVDEWAAAIEQGPEAVEAVALTPGERGDDLRQVTPLAGVLPDDVRLQVIYQVREA